MSWMHWAWHQNGAVPELHMCGREKSPLCCSSSGFPPILWCGTFMSYQFESNQKISVLSFAWISISYINTGTWPSGSWQVRLCSHSLSSTLELSLNPSAVIFFQKTHPKACGFQLTRPLISRCRLRGRRGLKKGWLSTARCSTCCRYSSGDAFSPQRAWCCCVWQLRRGRCWSSCYSLAWLSVDPVGPMTQKVVVKWANCVWIQGLQACFIYPDHHAFGSEKFWPSPWTVNANPAYAGPWNDRLLSGKNDASSRFWENHGLYLSPVHVVGKLQMAFIWLQLTEKRTNANADVHNSQAGQQG